MAFWAAAIPLIASAAESIFNSKSQSKADRTQQEAFNRQIALQEEQFRTNLSQGQLPLLARDRATSQLMMDLGLGDPSQFEGADASGGFQREGATPAGEPSFLQNLQGFAPQQQGQLSEGEQAVLDQSLRGIEQSAAARGGAVSGNALKGLQDRQVLFREQMRQNRLANLASLAGLSGGQFSQSQNQANQIGMNMGDTMATQGQARASGLIGRANTFNSTLENLGRAAGSFFTPSTPAQGSGGATPGFTPNFSGFSLGR